MQEGRDVMDPFAPLESRSLPVAAPQKLALTLYTDSVAIRGSVETRMRRLSDVLNADGQEFIVVSDATMEEFRAKGQPVTRADFAQVNLESLLFAVTDSIVEPQAELRLVKSSELALVVVPPFKIVGRIHVLPNRDLREALAELTGRFIPVTDAYYWSDTVGESKTSAAFIAFNHARAQILAPHRELDPWAGMNTSS